MLKRLATACVLAVLAAPVQAQNKGAVTFYGYSDTSCGGWTEERSTQGANAWILRAYVLGFMSAYNAFAPAAEGEGIGSDADGIAGWIDNHCRAHPMDSLVNAMMALIKTTRS
jgi:hypothetical protein